MNAGRPHASFDIGRACHFTPRSGAPAGPGTRA